jgi:hypothetical protein
MKILNKKETHSVTGIKKKGVIQKLVLLLFTVIIIGFINSCYYDNIQKLYPNGEVCDTTGASYSKTVQPILSSQCYNCHSGSAPVGGFVLTDYNSVLITVNNGQLKGSVTGNGYPLMPLTGKLSDCNVNQIIAWINTGAPNN